MFDALITFAIRILGAVAAFGLQALLARLMGVSDFGHYVLVWTWLLSIGSLATLGFAESAIRFAPRYASRGRTGHLSAFFNYGFTAIAATSLVSAGVAAVVSNLLPISNDSKSLIFYVAIAMPFLALEYFLDGMARAMGWFRLTTIVIYIVRPLAIAAVCLSFYATGITLTADIICSTVIVALAFTGLILQLIMRQRIAAGGTRKAPTTAHRSLWIKASLPMLVVATLDDLMLNGDVALVGLLLSQQDAALYFVAGRILVLAGFAQFALYFVYGRSFSLALANRDFATLNKDFNKATLITLAGTIGAIAATLVAAPYLLKVYGGDYGEAQNIIWLLSLSFIARGFSGQAHELLLITGHQRLLTVINGAAIALGAILIVLLVPIWQLNGAAFAVAITTWLRGIALYLKARHAVSRPSLTSTRKSHAL